MRNKIAALIAALIASVWVFAHQAGAQAAAPPSVGMASGILVDAGTGKILWAKDDTMPRPPASLTKVLTAYVVLHNANLKDRVTITQEARNTPGSRIYAEAGMSFTVDELLWGLMLQSGNDAAIVLAQNASPDGTMPGFVTLMNETAAEIGAKNSHFANPHGYDEPGHVSTARDLALITITAMKDPRFAAMVSSKTHNVAWGDGTQHTFINHNKLLWRYPGTVGVKTGFTNGAGHSLISAVTRDGNTLIAVALGSPDHYGESTALFDWAFANLHGLRASPLGLIRESAKPATKSTAKKQATHGLEIVELEPEVVASQQRASTDPASAPLLMPTVAMLAAGLVGAWFKRRRARIIAEQRGIMAQLQAEVDRVAANALVAPQVEVNRQAPREPSSV